MAEQVYILFSNFLSTTIMTYDLQIAGKTLQKRVRRDTNIVYVVGVDYVVSFSAKHPNSCKEFSYENDAEGNVVSIEFCRKYIYKYILYVHNYSNAE